MSGPGAAVNIVNASCLTICAEGHIVRATTHGDELLQLVEIVNPEILIIDVIMNDVDTLEIISSLRRIHPTTKIITMSGNPHMLALAVKRAPITS